MALIRNKLSRNVKILSIIDVVALFLRATRP